MLGPVVRQTLFRDSLYIYITVEFANSYTYKSTLNMLPIEKYKRPEYKANICRLYHYSFSFNLFHNERGNFHSSGKYKNTLNLRVSNRKTRRSSVAHPVNK